MRPLLRVAMACLALTLSASAARAECRLGAVAVLPLQDHHFVFTGDVNGKPASFLLDTGSFATVFTRVAAARLGISLSQLDFDSHGVGGAQHTYRGVARRMRIGNMNADGMVVGGSAMFGTATGAVDGLFGMNMMAAYDIDLDLAGGHAILFEAEGGCRSPTVALAPPLYDVPLADIDHNRQAAVDIKIDGHTMRALIDSGTGHTFMYRNAASRLGVDLSGLRAAGRLMVGGIGPRAVAAMKHVFARVEIGSLVVNYMPITIIDQADSGYSRVPIGSHLADLTDGDVGGEDMLLGADFMQKVHLWISHSSHRLIMQYPPQPSVLPR